MKKILIFLLSIALISCNPCKLIMKRVDKHDCISFDTTTIIETHDTIIYRDTIIYIQIPSATIRDTITLQVHHNIIKDVHKTFKSDYMTIVVDITNNVMRVNGTINKKKFSIVIKNALVKIIRERNVLKKVVITKKVNELTSWQRFLNVLGYIMLVAFLVVLIIVVINVKNKLLK